MRGQGIRCAGRWGRQHVLGLGQKHRGCMRPPGVPSVLATLALWLVVLGFQSTLGNVWGIGATCAMLQVA